MRAPSNWLALHSSADKNIEDQYKEAVRYMCQTIRGEKDFTEKEHEVAKPVSSN